MIITIMMTACAGMGKARHAGPGGMGELRQSVKVGKLNLVDLAGSERVHITGATGHPLFTTHVHASTAMFLLYALCVQVLHTVCDLNSTPAIHMCVFDLPCARQGYTLAGALLHCYSPAQHCSYTILL